MMNYPLLLLLLVLTSLVEEVASPVMLGVVDQVTHSLTAMPPKMPRMVDSFCQELPAIRKISV